MDFRGQPEILNAEDYGLSGTEPVINQECMLVHEKSGHYVKLSGTAIIDNITASNSLFEAVCSFISADQIPQNIFSPNKWSVGWRYADCRQEKFKQRKGDKIMKKKLVAGLLTGAMMAALLTGCAGSGSDKSSDAKESYTIGIEQFAEHGSLDNCREGFLQGLEEEGIKEGDNLKVETKNAAADMGTAGQISDSFVSDKVDLICAIATPSAQSAYNAAMDAGIPVIYTAVTDPVAAELASEDGTPAGEVTGTSDKLPVEEQLKMIREMLPQAKTIGIMYTTSEANSVSAIKEYEDLVGKYDFELVTKGITTTADVSLAADDLLSKVDCITNLTDNTVVASLPTILEKANDKKIPVFGSEIEQVKIGCLAAEGIDYISLGKQTGKMAAQVLKGEKKASELNFETITTPGFYVNNKVAENLGITVPTDLSDNAVETFDEITQSK